MPLRKKLLKALVVIGLIGVVYNGYRILVPDAADELPVRYVADESADFGLLETFALQITAPIVTGNRVTVLENGDEIFPAMLGAIRGASRSVDLLTYVYWSGDIASEFADALAGADERGVEVRVILDAYGASRMPEEVRRTLEGSGVDVAWFHPVRWYNLNRLNHRTHRKVMVVDDSIAFTGGVGIAQEWTGDARNPGEWRDDHFLLEGPIVRGLAGAFAENWRDATGEVLAQGVSFARGEVTGIDADSSGGARIVPVVTSPRGDVSNMALLYWLVLARARESVDIVTPYFVPDGAVLDALSEAAARGLRVRLLVPGAHNDSWLVKVSSATRIGPLLDAGVLVYEYQPTMLHQKTVVADARWSVIGSPNFDNRSFELNDEIALLVDHEPLAARLIAGIERDIALSVPLDRARLAERPLWDRVGGWAALLLREQL
jgi:cardiolipin synthase